MSNSAFSLRFAPYTIAIHTLSFYPPDFKDSLQHCYVVENSHGQIVSVMVLHPQDKVFEVEDFHVKELQRNK